MAQRTVKGTIRKLNSIWAFARIEFILSNPSFTDLTQYPQTSFFTRADVLGKFTVSLWVNSEGLIPSKYSCVIENDDPFDFTISPGATDLELSLLRAAGTVAFGSPAWTTITKYVDDRINSISLSGVQWIVINQSITLELNKAYVVDSLVLLSLQLPINPVTGDRVTVYAKNGLFKIIQTTDQRCQVGNQFTTQGLTGSIMSVSPGDFIDLVFIVSLWSSVSISGNLQVI